MNKIYVYLGLSIVFSTILLGILIAIVNMRFEYVVCNVNFTNNGPQYDCYIVSQKIGDYLLNNDKVEYKDIGGK